MRDLIDRLRTRLLPALLTAAGVSLVSAGLLWYTGRVDADLDPGASPIVAASEGAQPTDSAGATAGDSPSPPDTPWPTIHPAPSLPPASASATPVNRTATRVVVPALRIDLPVVEQPKGFPYCNVAMWWNDSRLAPPGLPGATYIDAHARTGMFLPLLTQSQINNGKRMIGMLVEVYTSDDMLFLYEINRVLRHVPPDTHFLDGALAATDGEIWLQTSEGPNGTFPKLQVVGKLLSGMPADHAAAHPTAHIVACS